MKLKDPEECSIEGCTREAYARTWCRLHYQRWRRVGITDAPTVQANVPCTECGEPSSQRNLCNAHYQRLMGYSKATGPVRGRGTISTYSGARRALNKPENHISTKTCALCDLTATRWILDVTKRIRCPRSGHYFSPDLADYTPMCRRHAREYGRRHQC